MSEKPEVDPHLGDAPTELEDEDDEDDSDYCETDDEDEDETAATRSSVPSP